MRSRQAKYQLTPKRIAIALVVLALAIVGGRWLVGFMSGAGETRTARVRVTELFEALADPRTGDVALTRWYGSPLPSDPDLSAMLRDEFRGFCDQHQLRPMRRFKIREARETGERDRLGAAVVVVSGVANGEPFRLRVQRGRTISWID